MLSLRIQGTLWSNCSSFCPYVSSRAGSISIHHKVTHRFFLANGPDQKSADGARVTPADSMAAVEAISRLLTMSAFDLVPLLDEIARTTASRMGFKASALRLIDDVSGELVLKAVHGLSDRFLSEGPRFDNQSRFRRFIANGGVLNVVAVSDEPDVSFAEAARTEGICSMLAVGLYSDDELIGALSVYTAFRHEFSEAEVQTFSVIANQVSTAIMLARFHEVEAEKDRLEQELVLAAEIQARVFPITPADIDGFEIAAFYESWDEVGGDFYDFIRLPEDNLGIGLGDVSGKGIWAALLMFAVRTALRANVEHSYKLREIMSRVNKLLYADTEAEQFATLVYGVLNIPKRVFTYSNASNPPPILIRKERLFLLEKGGLPVGILADAKYEEEVIQLESGDLMVFYSDGYTEVFNSDVIVRLEDEINKFLGPSDDGDDRTLVVVKAL